MFLEIGSNKTLDGGEREIGESLSFRVKAKLDTNKVHLLERIDPSPEVSKALDSLVFSMGMEGEDSIGIILYDPDLDDFFKTDWINIQYRDIVELSPDSLLDKYEIKGLIPRIAAKQHLKLDLEPAEFSRFFLGSVIWMILAMMLALAWVLKLLYIRRKRYYVEHLVFSFHYHAFSFLMMALALIIGSLSGPPGEGDGPLIGALIAFVVILVYLYIAMYRVYRQGIFKTFIKYNFLNFFYLFLFNIFSLPYLSNFSSGLLKYALRQIRNSYRIGDSRSTLHQKQSVLRR